MREWLIAHPQAVAVLFAVCAAFMVVEAFESGREIEAARIVLGDADRLASEALGG